MQKIETSSKLHVRRAVNVNSYQELGCHQPPSSKALSHLSASPITLAILPSAIISLNQESEDALLPLPMSYDPSTVRDSAS